MHYFCTKFNLHSMNCFKIVSEILSGGGVSSPCLHANTGNKLEGDWGEIVALGAEISPLKEPREKWGLPKKKKKKKIFFFF